MKKTSIPLSFLSLLIYLCACNNNNDSTSQNVTSTVSEVKAIFINGDSIHYIDVGKGDPVVFVHGAFGDYRTFDAQMESFSKNHRVISYSKRLYYPNNQIGNPSTNVSDTGHAKDLTELLKALNLGPVHLFGHSGGGGVALLATLQHPELIRSLILGEAVVPSLLPNVPGGDSAMNSLFETAIKPSAEGFKNNNIEKGVSAFVNGVMGDSLYFNKLPQHIRVNMISNAAEVKHNLLHPSPSPQITCDHLKKLNIPTLLIKGDKSVAFFSLMIDEMYRCLPNREKAVLTNTNHGLEYENPGEFNKIVLGFIDKH